MRPLWLLDIDGVLNVLTDQPGYEILRASMSGHGLTIRYRPSVIERIRALADRVDIRWLTTWCGDALPLAVALGLPVFPVEGADVHRTHTPKAWWKSMVAQALCEAEPDRPLIWTDDDLHFADSLGEVGWLYDRDRRTTVCISPRSTHGLEDHHLDYIDGFLDACERIEATA